MEDFYFSKCGRTCKLYLIFYGADQFVALACCLVKIKDWSCEIFGEIANEVVAVIAEILLFAGNVEFWTNPTGCLFRIHHKFWLSQKEWKLRGAKIYTALLIPSKSAF